MSNFRIHISIGGSWIWLTMVSWRSKKSTKSNAYSFALIYWQMDQVSFTCWLRQELKIKMTWLKLCALPKGSLKLQKDMLTYSLQVLMMAASLKSLCYQISMVRLLWISAWVSRRTIIRSTRSKKRIKRMRSLLKTLQWLRSSLMAWKTTVSCNVHISLLMLSTKQLDWAWLVSKNT